ncbi:MAG TPA: hypothetical protein DEA08_38370 [Planctomycetes bacterium]|nr:hypothetical protein [Planctomycetota bacterium]
MKRDRPVPIFKDPSKATSPPLSEEARAECEQALGRALPAAYLELLAQEANGGKLRRDLFPHPEVEGGARIGYLLGVGGPRGVAALQILAGHWKYPVAEGVLIASEGPKALLLDYAAGPEPSAAEPSVVFVDMKHPGGPLCVELAPDFASFLAGLVDGTPTCDWVIPSEVRLEQAKASLVAAGWEAAEDHYGNHRLTREGLELRLLPNNERDGDGFAYVEYSEFPLVAQLHGEREAILAAAGGVGEALGGAAVQVQTPAA